MLRKHHSRGKHKVAVLPQRAQNWRCSQRLEASLGEKEERFLITFALGSDPSALSSAFFGWHSQAPAPPSL